MIKRIFTIVSLTFLVLGCEKPHPENYMSISGKFDNVTEKDSILYITGFAVKKKIQVASDGTFQDSLKITKPAYHSITFGGDRAYLYLKNGFDLHFTGNKNNFFKSFVFKGNSIGAQSNQFVVDQYKFGQSAGSVKGFMILKKDDFLKKIDLFRNGMDSIAQLYPKAISTMVEESKKQNERFFKNLMDNYDTAHDHFVKEKETLERLKEGNPAPQFVDFENYLGGKNKLADYKGKYVYIDVWATWCRPCIVQIPYLKKIQERYQEKNIEFISISTDDDKKSGGTWKEAGKRWRKMIREKNLGGVHLWAEKQATKLDEDYWIKGIPRFILIDPEGNLVSYNARRPSDPKLIEQLDRLLE